ncbi:MAG: hypothetical protein AAGF12_33290 [Myxococcota bacterium]
MADHETHGDGIRGPFSALLRAAGEDLEAAHGLALAYRRLSLPLRRRLLDATLADAAAEGISPLPALMALAAVEPDLEQQATIQALLKAAGGDFEGSLSGPPRAFLGGNEAQGSAIVQRPLYGSFVELWSLRWHHGEVDHSHEPLVPEAAAAKMANRVGATLEVAPARARAVIAEVLWTHRNEHGELPHGAEAFASLL